FVGDPEAALLASVAGRDGAGALAVRLGVNLGPVRLVKDLNAQLNIIGDGINVAQRVMSFARPGQLLVSRSFYEVVSCLSRDYANLFHHEGARTDKHVREHDVYSVVGGTSASPRPGRQRSAERGQPARAGEKVGEETRAAAASRRRAPGARRGAVGRSPGRWQEARRQPAATRSRPAAGRAYHRAAQFHLPRA